MQARHHDLSGARFAGAVHRQQVAIENAGVAHAHAAHLQQVIGVRLEQLGIHLIALLDVGFGKDRAACRDPADQRQAKLLLQPDAARGAGQQFYEAFPGQGLEMVFGGIGGAEAEDAGDLGARRRKPGVLGEIIDQAQDFGLAWGQFIHLGYS